MFQKASSPPALLTLIVLTAGPIMTLNMFLPTLPTMARDFDVSYGTVSLSVSLYMLLTAALQIVFGPLSDRFGRRPVMLCAVGVFAVASIGCTFAQTFETFLLWRMLQAAVIASSTLSFAIVRDTLPPGEAATRLGTIGAAMAIAPMLAPAVGGLLLGLYGWRIHFALFSGLGVLLLWIIWTDVGETAPATYGSVKQLLQEYRALLKDRVYWSFCACLGLSTSIFYAYLAGVPLVAETQFGLPPAIAGAALGAPPVGFMIGASFTSRFGDRFQLVNLMVIGRLVTLSGLLLTTLLFSLDVLGPYGFLLMMTCIGLGNGLTVPTGMSGAMSARSGLSGTAAGLSGAVMLALGAVTATLSGQLLQDNGSALILLALLTGLTAASTVVALPALRAQARPA